MGIINKILFSKTSSRPLSGYSYLYKQLFDSLVDDDSNMLPAGLYEPGAIALWQEGNVAEAEAMMTSSWDDLEANGVIAISKGVELPDDLVMNEYGFYFGVPYAMTMDGETARLTFNEDGSAVMKANGETMEIPAGAIIYGDHSIDMTAMNMPVFVVSDDGTAIEGDGVVLSLEILDLPEINEYGFYFGVFYGANMEGMTVGFTFNEDGSVTMTQGDEIMPLPAGTAIYGDHTIDMTAIDGPVIGVSPDGTMLGLDGVVLSVSSSSVPPKGTVYLPNRTLIEGDLVLPNDGRAIILPMSTFAGQTSLTGIMISDTLTSISGRVFEGCDSLASVTIPDSVTSIGGSAFRNCSSLEAVYISNITAWCNISFKDNYSNPLLYAENLYLNGELVTNLVIPNSITTIGEYAFYDCSSLTSVTIPNSVTTIGEHAFYNCSNLTSITIGNSITHIGYRAFCHTGLTSFTIPDSVTSIGADAFSECYDLTSIIIPNSVTSIHYLSYCTNLKSLTIPNSVTNLGYKALAYCRSLTNITFEGTTTQWNAIFKEKDWNQGIPAIYVQCSDGQVAL
jgi:hypothetical protein